MWFASYERSRPFVVSAGGPREKTVCERLCIHATQLLPWTSTSTLSQSVAASVGDEAVVRVKAPQMDGPQVGPTNAFAKLAELNPLQARPARALASTGGSCSDSIAFVLLRPAVIKGSLVSEICLRFERRGLTLCAMRMLKPGADLSKNHYGSVPKSELVELVSVLAPGPVIVTLWKGPNALSTVRTLVGDDDPARALPGSIRGDLSVVKVTADPLIELAKDDADVARLRDLWFEASDLSASATSLATPPPPRPAAPSAAGGAPPAESATLPPLPPKPECGSYFITTAINYANGPPHMGHAYEAIAADVIARYHRAYGREVFFLTGADEHGQKIADTAAAQGLQPIELCNKHVAQFQELDHTLNCRYDGYVRTTSDAHKTIARKLWAKCEQQGGVYLGMYVGWYNVREETFVTDSDALANDYKDPSSGVPLKKMEEPSYFFKLSEYQQKLIEHIQTHADFIVPEARRNEVLERLAVPLKDLSVSRTTFDWGISVPGDIPGHVMYVWFDALSNYITAIGYDPTAPDPSRSSPLAHFWPASCHLIGKDIIWFHCVIWPALLMCAGVPLPKTVLAHGFVHGPDGRKMSKSYGNVVDPYDVLARFPVDSFRFFLMRECTFGGDVTFNETALALRHNAELADTFGNLVNRSLNLCKSYTDGKIPSQLPCEIDLDVDKLRTATEAAYKNYQIDVAASLATSALSTVNKFLTDKEPWKIKDDPHKRLVILRTTLEAIYVACHFLAPFLTDGVGRVFTMLGTPPLPICQLRSTLTNLQPGTLTSVGDIMYAKVDTAEALAAQASVTDGH